DIVAEVYLLFYAGVQSVRCVSQNTKELAPCRIRLTKPILPRPPVTIPLSYPRTGLNRLSPRGSTRLSHAIERPAFITHRKFTGQAKIARLTGPPPPHDIFF